MRALPVLILQHIEEDPPGILQEVLQQYQIPFSTLLGERDELPQALDRYSALVILGGPQSATDITAIIEREKWLIGQALRQSIPYLGICLGSQLLASVCGAEILSGAATEIGFSTVQLTEKGKADPLFAGWKDATHQIFQWHHDSFSLPTGALLLEEGKSAIPQGFRMGPCAYGVQYHPELTGPLLELWFREHPEREQAKEWMEPDAYQRLMYFHEQDHDRYAIQSRHLFKNFLQICGLVS